MPIKFTCPHCKKLLSVKDHLAGKKGACPACKKVLTVPLESAPLASPSPPNSESASAAAGNPVAPKATPSNPAAPKAPPSPANGHSKVKAPAPAPAAKPAPPPPPSVDVEAAAAAAFADEPPPAAETAAPTFIDFNCPQCDEPLHLNADLAGKRAPCPECKRIIKVPELKKQEKLDWRKTNAQGLPSGARRPDEPVPEGAWGTATSATNVSRTALEEANVLPDRYYQPLTLQQKIMRGVMAGAVFVVFLSLAVGAFAWWRSSREARSVKNVEDYANSPAAAQKIGREGQAALFIALGEYQLHTKQLRCAEDAEKLFGKAIDTLTPADLNLVNLNERDAILADLALLQIDLAGNKDQVDNKLRLKWDEAHNAFRTSLHAMKNGDARLEAYRAVCRRLIASNETKRAVALAGQLSDDASEQAEARAVAGLELLAAKQPVPEDITRLFAAFEQKEGRPMLTPSVVALGDALELKRKIEPNPDPDNKHKTEEEINLAIGHAEKMARDGKWNDALDKIGTMPLNDKPLVRLRAFTALAAAGDAKSDNPVLQEAMKLAADPRLQIPAAAWYQLSIVAAAAHAGVGDDQLNALVAAIQDPGMAGRARLLVLQQKLTDKNAAALTPLPNEPPNLAHYLSVKLLARQKRSFDAANADDADRAFGIIGELLGSMSK